MTPEVRPQNPIGLRRDTLFDRLVTNMGRFLSGITANETRTELAVINFADMVRLAQGQVIVVSGSLPPEVYAHPSLLEALGEAANRPDVKVSILFGPNPHPHSITALRSVSRNIALYQHLQEPKSYFAVVDSRHIRVVSSQFDTAELSLQTPGHHAHIWHDIPTQAHRLEEKFTQLLKDTKPLTS